MNPVVIIFARMSSKRLPGKMLKKIGTQNLISHIIYRCKKITQKSNLILATSKNKLDDPLVKEAQKAKINFFRGNLNNVVIRAYKCCLKFKANFFVRVCGDRIFLNYKEIDKSITKCKRINNFDLASNLLGKKIPAGRTIEIISVKAIKKILKSTKNKYDLEHVTTYIYKNKKKFNLIKLKEPAHHKFKFSYAIDNIEDLERSKYIAKKVKNFKDLSDKAIFRLTKKWYMSQTKQ